jgi:peptidoglycan/xylan/chitin deacetylase (PgdA/CDA1 family)
MNKRKLLTVMGAKQIKYSIPTNLVTTEGTLLEGFETGADWTAANGAVAEDTTNFISGSKSLKVTTNEGAVTCTVTKAVTWNINPTDIRLNYYCYDAVPSDACNGIYITMYSQENLARFYQVVVYPRAFGWNSFHIRLTDWAQTGADTWETNPRVKFRISVLAKAGQVSTISFDSLLLDRISDPAVLVTFDDGGASIYNTAFNYMRQKRIVGTAYLITGGATLSNYDAMYAEGFDLGNHTVDHVDLTTLTQEQIQTQLSGAKTALDAAGFTRASSHVAYPYGTSNATVRAAMTAESMLSGRNVTTAAFMPFVNPLNSYYSTPCLNVGTPGITLATAKGYIDTAKARGDTIIILFHTLVATDPAADQWLISDFYALMDYIVTSNVRTLTISEWYALQTAPIVITHK